MKNVGGWIILSAIVLGFFFRDITGYSIPEFTNRFFAGEVTSETLRQMAQEQNRRLPIASGDEQTWVSTEADNMTLTHTYRVARPLSQAETASARVQAIRNISSSNCADRAVTRLLENGVRINYVYVDPHNRLLFSVVVDSSLCQRRDATQYA